MPRIPRRFKGGEQASAPAPDPAGAAAPQTTGDPLAAPAPAPGQQPTSVLEPAAAEGAIAGEPTAGHAILTTESGEPVAAPDGATAEAAPVAEHAPPDATPRFRARSRMRRRLRYLRRRRELAFRDLGGLVFDLHRFGRDRGDLVAQKLDGLRAIDGELRTLEGALGDRRDTVELREPGIAACPRCQTLHDSDANFCPGCGVPLRGSVVRDAAPVTVAPADEQQPSTPASS